MLIAVRPEINIKTAGRYCSYICDYYDMQLFENDHCRLFNKQLKGNPVDPLRCQQCLDVTKKT